MSKENIKGNRNQIPGKDGQTFTNLPGSDSLFREDQNDIGLMRTISIASIVAASVVLVVFFLLFGGEVIAGLVLFSWMLITRKAQIGRRVSAKTQGMALPIGRSEANANFVEHPQDGSMDSNYQTQRKLAR
jgi:hypothetical protein